MCQGVLGEGKGKRKGKDGQQEIMGIMGKLKQSEERLGRLARKTEAMQEEIHSMEQGRDRLARQIERLRERIEDIDRSEADEEVRKVHWVKLLGRQEGVLFGNSSEDEMDMEQASVSGASSSQFSAGQVHTQKGRFVRRKQKPRRGKQFKDPLKDWDQLWGGNITSSDEAGPLVDKWLLGRAEVAQRQYEKAWGLWPKPYARRWASGQDTSVRPGAFSALAGRGPEKEGAVAADHEEKDAAMPPSDAGLKAGLAGEGEAAPANKESCQVAGAGSGSGASHGSGSTESLS